MLSQEPMQLQIIVIGPGIFDNYASPMLMYLKQCRLAISIEPFLQTQNYDWSSLLCLLQVFCHFLFCFLFIK
jgi:hypothetical protein